jgi:hypothetical protein
MSPWGGGGRERKKRKKKGGEALQRVLQLDLRGGGKKGKIEEEKLVSNYFEASVLLYF